MNILEAEDVCENKEELITEYKAHALDFQPSGPTSLFLPSRRPLTVM